MVLQSDIVSPCPSKIFATPFMIEGARKGTFRKERTVWDCIFDCDGMYGVADRKWNLFHKWQRHLKSSLTSEGRSKFLYILEKEGCRLSLRCRWTIREAARIRFSFRSAYDLQLERKRHIGNDIVNIVFTDDNVHNTFNPQCVKSHFTRILCKLHFFVFGMFH